MFGDVSIGDVHTEIARARRAAKQADEKERAMISRLNDYRRAKDRSEARVRELAVQLQEAALDSRAWRTQERRVEENVACATETSAEVSISPSPRGSSTVGKHRVLSFPGANRNLPNDASASENADGSENADASDASASASSDDAGVSRAGGKRDAGEHPVFRRIRHGRVGETFALFTSGAVDPNSRDRFGNTPLIVAAQNDRKRIAKMLVKTAGADVNLRNEKGNTALHYCYAYGHFELGTFLERKGADFRVANGAGVAPRDVFRKDPEAERRWRQARRDAEIRNAAAESRRNERRAAVSSRSSFPNAAQRESDSDDGFGTDVECGFETSDEDSDASPRAGNEARSRGCFENGAQARADDVDEDDDSFDGSLGLDSYRALHSGRR
jgi:hypothetical protein